jgi:hypothetical protein
MKCPNCNREIENDSVFCEYCGVNVMQTYLMNATTMRTEFLEKNASYFPKKKIPKIKEELLHASYNEYLKDILSEDYAKIYSRAYKTRLICGFFLQLIFIFSFYIWYFSSDLYYSGLYDYSIDTIILCIMVGISFLSYLLFPSPKKKVFNLFVNKWYKNK